MNRASVQIGCAYAGYLFVFGFAIGFLVLAGFVPPPAPSDSAVEIARRFQGHAVAIRAGMVICILFGALLLPWGGAVARQLRRSEPEHSALTYAWIGAAALLCLETIYPCAGWAIAAFRPGRNAEITRTINDASWLAFIGVASTMVIQCLLVAATSLREPRPDPIFPHWFGYLSLSCALLLIPADLIFLFKSGPLAWDGLISFWIPVVAAFSWVLVTTAVTVVAIKREPIVSPNIANDALAQRVARLERELRHPPSGSSP